MFVFGHVKVLVYRDLYHTVLLLRICLAWIKFQSSDI